MKYLQVALASILVTGLLLILAQPIPHSRQTAPCSAEGELGFCVIELPPDQPPPKDNGGPPPVPYWVWYTYSCGREYDPSGSQCNDLAPYECTAPDGQGGRYMVLMREDFIPPSPPRPITEPFCTRLDLLPPPDRPDPVVRQKDLDEFQFAKPRIEVEPGPNTLIRFNNNIFTKKFDQSWDLNLLGKSVIVRAYPVEFRWDYGDGTTFVTDKPGWPKRLDEGDVVTDTSHAYSNTGTYTVTLTTIYKAMYSVEGKPELPVDGQAEVVSEPVTIDVWRTDIRNVDEACAENPESWGCPGTVP